jgi:hypothetical protein
MFKFNLVDLIKKKYQQKNQPEKAIIIFEVKVSFLTNFQIKYPYNNNQSLIKEFFAKEWRQEIGLTHPENAYLKIFISRPASIAEAYVTLSMHHIRNNITVQKMFSIEEDPTIAKWCGIDWQTLPLMESETTI